MTTVRSEDHADYQAASQQESSREVDILRQACDIITERFRRLGEPMTSPDITRQFLIHNLATRESEAFWCLYLNTKHHLIEYEELFRGTIDGAAVYPREVVKAALRHNAAALIVAHNHPSGVPEPSAADNALTRRLREALALVDIRLLDHMVVGGTKIVSFAERGLI